MTGQRTRQVLFVCVGNAGRSQMAEAAFNHLATGRFTAISAGTRPASRMDPTAVAAMRETGIDMRGQRPKLLTMEMARSASHVISMGCGVAESCPAGIIPTADWGLDDAKGQPIEAVRALRDEIIGRVRALIAELDAGESATSRT